MACPLDLRASWASGSVTLRCCASAHVSFAQRCGWAYYLARGVRRHRRRPVASGIRLGRNDLWLAQTPISVPSTENGHWTSALAPELRDHGGQQMLRHVAVQQAVAVEGSGVPDWRGL